MEKNSTRPLHPYRSACWGVFDVVQLCKDWCTICTKSRVHEVYMDWWMCVTCGEKVYKGPGVVLTPEQAVEVIEDIAPNFNVTQFVKENME